MFTKFINTLNKLANKYKHKIIISAHPRTLKKLNNSSVDLNSLIQIHPPFGFFDYVNLQINAFVTLSDSGTINEEASILNIPAINLRETNERPEAMEEGSSLMVGMDIDRIFQSIELLTDKNRVNKINKVSDYNSDNFSERVVRTIYSHINYVNTYIWHK